MGAPNWDARGRLASPMDASWMIANASGRVAPPPAPRKTGELVRASTRADDPLPFPASSVMVCPPMSSPQRVKLRLPVPSCPACSRRAPPARTSAPMFTLALLEMLASWRTTSGTLIATFPLAWASSVRYTGAVPPPHSEPWKLSEPAVTSRLSAMGPALRRRRGSNTRLLAWRIVTPPREGTVSSPYCTTPVSPTSEMLPLVDSRFVPRLA